MSRIILPGKDNRQVTVGLDSILGYFFQLWASKEEVEQLNNQAEKHGIMSLTPAEYDIWNDDPIIDVDTNYPNYTSRINIIELIKAHCLPSPIVDTIVQNIMLDQSI